MSTVKEDLSIIQSITNKYLDNRHSDDLRKWIACCFAEATRPSRSFRYRDKLITYLSEPELFNVLVIGPDGHPRHEKTVLMSTYLEKNFAILTLKELQEIIVCSLYDLWQTVCEIEKEIYG
jgi:hypothetical protein